MLELAFSAIQRRLSTVKVLRNSRDSYRHQHLISWC